ncbi:MAG: hypothetical protein ABSB59_21730 [Streptosporangiaceae bacterium]|jgi:hypothetical protein
MPEPRLTSAPESEPRPADPAEPVPGLIRGYLDGLATRLPASVTDELADGLTETYRFYLSEGLEPAAAAAAAVTEFGAPAEITAGFAEVNPARRAARRLLRIGPAVGACWLAALLTSRVGRSWTGWIASAPTWAVTGAVLAGLIGLLAVAALGRRYRLATATGVAGCFGFATLDTALIVAAIFVLAPVGWFTALAIAASAARIAVTARALRPALAR